MGWKPDAGWDRLKEALDPARFTKEMRRQLKMASRRNGKIMEAAVRRHIKKGGFEKNAALTIAIKGSSKPLVDHGQLFQFITSRIIGDFSLFVGVLRSDEHYNIIAAIHQGVTIPVTDAMRGMFFALWQASTGVLPPSKLTGRAAELWARKPGGWLPLKASTKYINIPARRFFDGVMADAALIKRLKGNWRDALWQTFKSRAKKA